MKEKSVIEIDVTSPLTCPRNDFESLFDRTDKIIDLIRERLRDINFIKMENLNERKEFEKYASSDSIVIDGRRGTGKTTHLLTLKERLKKELPEVFCLNVIDPANLSDDIDILQVFLAELCKTLQKQLESKDPLRPFARNNSSKFYDKRYLFEEISSSIHDISLILRKFSRFNKSDLVENEHEAMFMNYEMLNLPFKVHLLAKKVCNFLGVDAIVVPIDDIDMNLMQTHKVLSFIKDFFSTPYLIPIVALDASQALAVIKKRKHEFFGLKISDSPSELDDSLEFLRKLPAEWIQKPLPPSRRIVLPDVLQIYENYIKREKQKEIYFIYEGNGRRIKVEFSEAVHLLLAIVYEWNHIPDFKEKVPYHVKNVLEGKSIRDFINDIRAILQGIAYSIKEEKENELLRVEYDISYLKARYKPFSIYKEIDKFDSVRWFWKTFQKVFEKRYRELEKENYKRLNLRDVVREVLRVADEDNKIVPRLEKTFYRLVMQEFYVISTFLYLKRERSGELRIHYYKENVIHLVRKYNFEGIIELILRTILPAYILFYLVREKIISFEEFNWGEFYPLYASSSEEEIRDFFNRLTNWTLIYGRNYRYPLYIYIGNERERDNNIGLFKWIGEGKVFKDLTLKSLAKTTLPDYPAFYYFFLNPFSFFFITSKSQRERETDSVKLQKEREEERENDPEIGYSLSIYREAIKYYGIPLQ